MSLTPSNSNEIKILLIGNPNTGKSTLFNLLSHKNQQCVGNWAGVTIKSNETSFTTNGKKISLIDLPGIYSMNEDYESNTYSANVINFILNKDFDLIINLLDASNLKRNLYLTIQLLEMQLPIIIGLNMIDITSKQGLIIDEHKIASLLNVPVIPLITQRNQGIDRLLKEVLDYKHPTSHEWLSEIYDKNIQELIFQLGSLVTAPLNKWQILRKIESQFSGHEITLSNSTIAEKLIDDFTQQTKIDSKVYITDKRYEFIDKIIKKSTNTQHKNKSKYTNKLDKIVLSKYLGLPIFLLMIYGLFTFSIVGGAMLQDFFAYLSEKIFMNYPQIVLKYIDTPSFINFIIFDCLWGGIKAVSTFIPIIGCFYFSLSCLEESGYLGRAAFIIDRIMAKIDLSGKAFFPLIIGFGCNVPGILATKMLQNPKERIMVSMMSPFMSCGARLSVYALFCAVFFPQHGHHIVLALYLIGIAVGIITGYLTKKLLGLKGRDMMILELPNYRFPGFNSVIKKTYFKIKNFVFGAGKLIVIMFIILKSLNSITPNLEIASPEAKSILETTAQKIHPIFIPIGIGENNWEASVGIITGIFAKEVVVGTLGALYTVNNNAYTIQENSSLKSKVMHKAMLEKFNSKIAVFAYLLFILLYFPCISVFATLMKEFGIKWAMFSAIWTTLTAYIISILFYRGAILLGF